MGGTKILSCPNCGTTDNFATVEKIYATCRVEEIYEDGSLEWLGETDWDDSETVGLVCFECNWKTDRTDFENILK